MKISARFFVLLVSLCLFANCKDRIKDGFDMRYQRDFEILAGTQALVVKVYDLGSVPADTAIYFSSNGATGADISRVRPNIANIRNLTSGTGFGFIEVASVWMIDPADPDNRKEIFYRQSDIPLNEDTQLDLYANLPDIKSLVFNGIFDIEVVLRLRDPAPEAMLVRVDFSLRAETE